MPPFIGALLAVRSAFYMNVRKSLPIKYNTTVDARIQNKPELVGSNISHFLFLKDSFSNPRK